MIGEREPAVATTVAALVNAAGAAGAGAVA